MGELLDAARFGEIDEVKALLSSGQVDVNQKDADGKTALHMAAANGHVEIVKMLLEIKGIDINAQNNSKNTALHWACLAGAKQVVVLLLAAGIDVTVENHGKLTAIDEASMWKHDDIVQLLVDHPLSTAQSKASASKAEKVPAKEVDDVVEGQIVQELQKEGEDGELVEGLAEALPSAGETSKQDA